MRCQYFALAGFRRRNSRKLPAIILFNTPSLYEVDDRHKKKKRNAQPLFRLKREKPVRGTVRAISKISEGETLESRKAAKETRGNLRREEKKIDPIVKTRSMDL